MASWLRTGTSRRLIQIPTSPTHKLSRALSISCMAHLENFNGSRVSEESEERADTLADLVLAFCELGYSDKVLVRAIWCGDMASATAVGQENVPDFTASAFWMAAVAFALKSVHGVGALQGDTGSLLRCLKMHCENRLGHEPAGDYWCEVAKAKPETGCST